MAEKIVINYEKVHQIGGQFDTLADQVKAVTQSLQQRQESLRGGHWIGKGANAFYREMDDAILPTLRALEEALRATRETFSDIALTFEAQDEELGQTVNSGEGTAAAPASGGSHIVRAGDTLWDIGQRYGVSVDQLMAANPHIADRNLIYPGQEIAIPGEGGATAAAAPPPAAKMPSNAVNGSGIGAQAYNRMIDDFNVESAHRYEKFRDGNPATYDTYCNLFASDVAQKYGAPLPIYVTDGNGTVTKWLGATMMKQWLDGQLDVPGQYTQGPENGWVKVDAATAASAANNGQLAVVAGHGHMAVVRADNPPNVTNPGDVIIAQAGENNFNHGRVQDGWGRFTGSAEFYVYNR